MSQLILEFPLPREAVDKSGNKLAVDLGNGVKLTTSIPHWVEEIYEIKLRLEMKVDGSPPDDNSRQTSVE